MEKAEQKAELGEFPMYDPPGETGLFRPDRRGDDRMIHASTQSLGLRIGLLVAMSLSLTGCGLSGYFISEENPEMTEGSPSQAQKSPQVKRTASPQRVSDALDLESLEQLLCERHPALRELRQKISVSRQSGESSWIPGARWSDSDTGNPAESDQQERQLALDWSPATLSREEREGRQRRSEQRVLSLQLEEVRNRLLLQLRLEWSEYWLLQQSSALLSDWLTELEVLADSDTRSDQQELFANLQAKVAEWNRQLSRLEESKSRIIATINSMSGRPRGAQLQLPKDPGDTRFVGVEKMNRHRRHPLEVLAAERGRFARNEIDFTDPTTWDGLVIGAQSRQEQGQPVAGTGQGNPAGDWILTVGVEIPLGSDEQGQFRREQIESAGSRRLELSRIQQQISGRLEEARLLIVTEDNLIENDLLLIEQSDVLRSLRELVQSENLRDFKDHWQHIDAQLQQRISVQRSIAKRAEGRFKVVELLALPLQESNGLRGLTRTDPKP